MMGSVLLSNDADSDVREVTQPHVSKRDGVIREAGNCQFHHNLRLLW